MLLCMIIYFDRSQVPTRRYCLPSGATRKIFIKILLTKLRGIRGQCWNAEKFLAFLIGIIQQKGYITGSKDVRKCIVPRLNTCEKGEFDTFTSSTIVVANEKMGQMRKGVDKS